jgi:hypothetical protein
LILYSRHVYADGVRVSDPDAALAGAKIELRIRPDWDKHHATTPPPGPRPGGGVMSLRVRTKRGLPWRPL